jgi:hypothetical protein
MRCICSAAPRSCVALAPLPFPRTRALWPAPPSACSPCSSRSCHAHPSASLAAPLPLHLRVSTTRQASSHPWLVPTHAYARTRPCVAPAPELHATHEVVTLALPHVYLLP